MMTLTFALKAAALGQLALAILNLFLPRLLGWKDGLARLPLLTREVFHVHAWFISLTVALFGLLTWRFADSFGNLKDSGHDLLALWLCTGIAIFWGIRFVLQWAYYSWEHWRGDPPKTWAHLILTSVYGGWTVVYALVGRVG